MHSKFEHHREIERQQEQQQLQNCALLCAYVYGQPGGWYAVAKGSIDGFASDYALVHSNPGNFANHSVRAIFAESAEEAKEYAEDLAEIQQAVQEANGMEEPPAVAVLAEEEKKAALGAVREAWGNYASGRIDGVLVRRGEAGIEALESGTLNGGERVAKGDMLDDAADRLAPLTEDDLVEWLRDLCGGAPSDLAFTDWSLVAQAVAAKS